MNPRRRVTLADLNYVMSRSIYNINNMPTNAKLPGAISPLTEGERRVVAIMEAVLSMPDKEADVVFDIPNSDSINDH